MLWALQNNQRTRAEPGAHASCPCCHGAVIPKCGSILTWHWAHKSLVECDLWWEPESQWHLNWKNQFPAECQEIVMANHRADVKTPKGIIEFQASSISPQAIEEREIFYDQMVWILRGSDFEDNFDIRESSRYAKRYCLGCGLKFGWPMREDRIALSKHCPDCGDDRSERIPEPIRPYWTFRWKHPRKSWYIATRPIGIDFDGMIFWIKKLYGDSCCAGWGTYQTHTDFISSYVKTVTVSVPRLSLSRL